MNPTHARNMRGCMGHTAARDKVRAERRSGELFEGLLDAFGDGGGGVVEVVADLEHGCRRSGKGLEGFEGGGPVDGSVAGPEVLVFEAVVVVNVEFADALAEGADGFGDSGRDVRVAEVEADADLVEVRHLKNLKEVFGRGGIAGEVFNEHADAEGTGKG